MKHIHVTCAIVEKDSKVLVTQRSEQMGLPLKWEFPGGKIQPGERPEECLRRELIEELGVDIFVGRALTPSDYNYPAFKITLYPYICHITSGEIELHEHKDCKWIAPEKLQELDWAAADIPVVEQYQDSL